MDSNKGPILYRDVRDYIEEYLGKNGKNAYTIDMDEVLLMVTTRFGNDLIAYDSSISVLFKALDDLGISSPVCHNELKAYFTDRLLHIPAIYYWDSDKGDLLDAEVFFFGRHMCVNVREFRHIISDLREGPLYVSARPIEGTYEDNPHHIYVGGSGFVANERIKEEILLYFEKINLGIMQEVNQNVALIEEQLSGITTEFITLVRNFLSMLPSSLFLDRENFIAFEHLISFNNYYTEQFVDSSPEDRDRIIEVLKENAGMYNNLKTIVDNDYRRFVQVAGKYLGIAEVYHSSVVWTLIRTAASHHFSQRWDKEYGAHLKVECQGLDQCVDLYCRCGDIPTKSMVAIGLFTHHLMSKGIFPKEINSNFVRCNSLLINRILEKLEEIELERFEKKLTRSPTSDHTSYSINDVDLMDGSEFEHFVSLLFTKMGYLTEVTRGSGDQGLDVTAAKNGIRIGIQAKRYSNKVTNKAIQEISAALNHYGCNRGMVITNNYFTDSAVELAVSNDIMLWDRDFLKMKLEEVFM